MWKKLLGGVALVIAAFLLFVATRPGSYRVERTAALAAPPDRVYARVADFHLWADWSPWAKLDPGMKTTYAGATGAPGSSYEWAGNDKVGRGRMTIREASPPGRLVILLQFIEPFASESDTTFTFEPEGAGTRVAWIMEGKADIMTRLFTAFSSMDALVGPDFEKGLQALKRVAEGDGASATR